MGVSTQADFNKLMIYTLPSCVVAHYVFPPLAPIATLQQQVSHLARKILLGTLGGALCHTAAMSLDSSYEQRWRGESEQSFPIQDVLVGAAMGGFLVLSSEAAPVLDRALERGLEQSAINPGSIPRRVARVIERALLNAEPVLAPLANRVAVIAVPVADHLERVLANVVDNTGRVIRRIHDHFE